MHSVLLGEQLRVVLKDGIEFQQGNVSDPRASSPAFEFVSTTLAVESFAPLDRQRRSADSPGVVRTIAVGVQITIFGFVGKSAKVPMSAVKSSSKRSDLFPVLPAAPNGVVGAQGNESRCAAETLEPPQGRAIRWADLS